MRILVVDDKPALLEAFSKILGVHHDVTTAHGGRAALDLLKRSSSFDAVLTDVEMTGVGGWQVYATCKQLYPHLVPKIIFWSSGMRPEIEVNVKATGNVLLEKPVDPAQLLEVIHLLVDAA